MTFIDMLYNRIAFPPPPLGAGRIHSIDDSDDEIPDQAHRFQDILWAIRAGEGGADTILRRLSYVMPKTLLVADCEELAERGLVMIRSSGTKTLYSTGDSF